MILPGDGYKRPAGVAGGMSGRDRDSRCSATQSNCRRRLTQGMRKSPLGGAAHRSEVRSMSANSASRRDN